MSDRTRLDMLAATLLLVAALGSSCNTPSEDVGDDDRWIIVTQAPVGQTAFHPEPYNRYPSGTRLVALDMNNPEADPRAISTGLDSAGSPSITIDGKRVIFIGRESGDEHFSLYSSPIDAAAPTKLIGEPYRCAGGAELPDGRIVFAAAVDDAVPPADLSSAWALFVLSPDDATVQRITFSGLAELDPFVLRDGRILYSQWLPGGDGRPRRGAFAIFTVHPDGTGMAPLHGHHDGPEWKLRPRQGTTGDVYFLASEAGEEARIRGARWTAPAENGFAVDVPVESPLAAGPTADGALLVSGATIDGTTSGLFVVEEDNEGARSIGDGSPDWDIVDAVEARPRQRPQGQLSMIDPDGSKGLLLAIDARPEGAGGQRAATARLSLAAFAGRARRVLGEAPLAADGSLYATVPANVPLLLDILDEDGRPVVETVTPFWVRPKEIRGCVGCHEDPESAPPNRRPLAVLDEPIDLVDEEGP